MHDADLADREVPTWLLVVGGWSWRLVAAAALGAVVLAILGAISVVVAPVLLGLFLTAAVAPLFERLARTRVGRGGAAALCALAYLAGIGAFLWIAFRALISPWEGIARATSDGLDALGAKLDEWGFDINTFDVLRKAGGSFASLLFNGVLSIVSVAVVLGATIVVSLLVTYFYLKDGPRMWATISKIGGRQTPSFDRMGRAAWDRLQSFVRGTAKVALVDAVGIALGALVLGVPSVGAIFVLSFVLAFIPYFGAIIAGAVAVLLALADGGYSQAVAMVVVVLVVQQVESILLQPFLVGKAVRLHPLVVMLGVLAGGALGGVMGMFFAVPIIAAVDAAFATARDDRDANRSQT